MSNTIGFNILQILLDLIGCILSLLQIVLDCYMTNDWQGLYSNPVKLYLSGIVFIYDLILLYQHYVLYININTMLVEDPTLNSYTNNPVYYTSIQNNIQMQNLTQTQTPINRIKHEQKQTYFNRFNILSNMNNKPSNTRSNEILSDFDTSLGASSLYFGNIIRNNSNNNINNITSNIGTPPVSSQMNYTHKPLSQEDVDDEL